MKINVIVKEPFKQPREMELEDELKTYQGIVGGYIQSVPSPFDNKVEMIVHEEGKLFGDKGNLILPEYNDVLVGSIVFVSFDKNGEFKSLEPKQKQKINKYIECCQVKLGEDVYSNDLNKLFARANKRLQECEMQ